MRIKFNELECQLLKFTDVTIYQKYKEQKEKSELLNSLNTSVHHEMICPLNINVNIAEELINKIHDEEIKTLARTLFISSTLLLSNANDLMDKEIIQSGNFVAVYQQGPLLESLHEILQMMSFTIQFKDLEIRL